MYYDLKWFGANIYGKVFPSQVGRGLPPKFLFPFLRPFLIDPGLAVFGDSVYASSSVRICEGSYLDADEAIL
jgi:hypothetical protein